MFEMPSDTISEHVIYNFFLGGHALNPLYNSILMLAVPSDLPDQCCVAKPVSITHAQWPTQTLI